MHFWPHDVLDFFYEMNIKVLPFTRSFFDLFRKQV